MPAASSAVMMPFDALKHQPQLFSRQTAAAKLDVPPTVAIPSAIVFERCTTFPVESFHFPDN
jgi:hypothetical protein